MSSMSMLVWNFGSSVLRHHDHVSLVRHVGFAPDEEYPSQVRVSLDHDLAEKQRYVVGDRVPARPKVARFLRVGFDVGIKPVVKVLDRRVVAAQLHTISTQKATEHLDAIALGLHAAIERSAGLRTREGLVRPRYPRVETLVLIPVDAHVASVQAILNCSSPRMHRRGDAARCTLSRCPLPVLLATGLEAFAPAPRPPCCLPDSSSPEAPRATR